MGNEVGILAYTLGCVVCGRSVRRVGSMLVLWMQGHDVFLVVSLFVYWE